MSRLLDEILDALVEFGADQIMSVLFPSLEMPFSIQLPKLSATIGDVTVEVAGSILIFSTSAGEFEVDINDVFEVINFICDVGIIDMILPGPVSIADLEVLCR